MTASPVPLFMGKCLYSRNIFYTCHKARFSGMSKRLLGRGNGLFGRGLAPGPHPPSRTGLLGGILTMERS